MAPASPMRDSQLRVELRCPRRMAVHCLSSIRVAELTINGSPPQSVVEERGIKWGIGDRGSHMPLQFSRWPKMVAIDLGCGVRLSRAVQKRVHGTVDQVECCDPS